MEETIYLLVKVIINYPDKNKRSEAIKNAKRCAISTSLLSETGCEPKSVRLYKKKNNDQKATTKD